MAKLNLTAPPAIKGVPYYKKYQQWIEDNFFDCNCGYCFSVCSRITLDHYIPVSLDHKKEHDPLNLVGCCDTCQSSTHKWDYHHKKTYHIRYKKIQALHAVHDIRNEDVEDLFDLNHSHGNILSKAGTNKARADFLRVLFSLDLPITDDKRNEERAIVLDMIKDVELFLQNKSNPALQAFAQQKLDKYLLKISRNEVWLYCLGVKIPQIIITELQSRSIKRSVAI